MSDSDHARIRRERNQRDQTAKENAALAAQRGEEIVRLEGKLESALTTVNAKVADKVKLCKEIEQLKSEAAESRALLRKISDALQRSNKHVDKLKAERANLQRINNELAEDLNTRLTAMTVERDKVREWVRKFRQVVVDTAPKKCPYPGRYIRHSGPIDPEVLRKDEDFCCAICSHAIWCKLYKESE